MKAAEIRGDMIPLQSQKTELATGVQRRLLRHALTLLTVLIFAGCGGVSTRFVTGLTPEQRAAAEELPVYEDSLAEGTYIDLGEVRGLSCQVTADSQFRATEDNALTELKRATVKAGGDAVMAVRCNRLARGQNRSNCFSAVECVGIAVTRNAAGD